MAAAQEAVELAHAQADLMPRHDRSELGLAPALVLSLRTSRRVLTPGMRRDVPT